METVQEIECWTDFLKENSENDIFKNRHDIIEWKDKRNEFTLTHGFLASTNTQNYETVKKFLGGLKGVGLLHQLTSKSRCEHIPLQSAIRSGADKDIIHLIATYNPHLTKEIITSRDCIKETPLECAFAHHQWGIVETLLDLCVKRKVLPELTGIATGADAPKQANTLLCKAAKRGLTDYFSILFRVCDQNRITGIDHLRIPDKKNRTPWFYVVCLGKSEVKKILDIAKKYKVDLNQLFINTQKQTMLHEAVRINDKPLENILRSNGMTEQQDISGLLPCQGDRNIGPNPRNEFSSVESYEGQGIDKEGVLDENFHEPGVLFIPGEAHPESDSN